MQVLQGPLVLTALMVQLDPQGLRALRVWQVLQVLRDPLVLTALMVQRDLQVPKALRVWQQQHSTAWHSTGYVGCNNNHGMPVRYNLGQHTLSVRIAHKAGLSARVGLRVQGVSQAACACLVGCLVQRQIRSE